MLDVAESQLESSKLCVTPNKQQHQAHLAGLKRLSARAASAGALTPPGTRRVVFSFAEYARSVIVKLQSRKVPIAEGLVDEEFERIEATYGFTFPPDLRAVLAAGLPVGAGFPNWRAGNPDHLRMRVSLPIAGLLHEVARAGFWWKPWGPRPADAKQAVRSARCALRRSSPLLIPLHGHCYLPSSPTLAANPVFFVYQHHVVHCGHDVADFLDREAFRSHKSEFGDLLYDMGSFRNDSSHRASSSSSGTDSSAADSSPTDSSWGRSLDVLAQQNTNHPFHSPRKPAPHRNNGFGRLHSRRHLSFDDGDPVEFFDDDIMKYSCVVEKALPLETLLSVAVDDARSPRRIEFWSDLAEKVHKELITSSATLVGDSARNHRMSSRWLNGYLGELSLILRQGGWREDDINDMIDTKSPPQHWNPQLDAEGVLVSLAREVELLSSSLKKAGWSVPDVTETMKMGLSALFQNDQVLH